MKRFGILCIFLLLHISPSAASCWWWCSETVNPDVVVPFTLQNGDELDVSFTQDKFDDFLGYICDKDVDLCEVKLGDELTVKKFEIDYGAPSNLKTWCTKAVKNWWADAFLGREYSKLEMTRCQHDDYWSRVNERCETVSRNDDGCNNGEVSVPLGALRRLKVAEDAQICTVCKKGDDCYNPGVTPPDITDDDIGIEVVSSTTTLRPPEIVTERSTKGTITSTIQSRTTESKSPGSPINAASKGEKDVEVPIIVGAAIAGGIFLLVIVILIVGLILWRRMRSLKDQKDAADDVSNQRPHQNGLYFVNVKNEMLEAEYQGPNKNGIHFVNPKKEMVEAEYDYLA